MVIAVCFRLVVDFSANKSVCDRGWCGRNKNRGGGEKKKKTEEGADATWCGRNIDYSIKQENFSEELRNSEKNIKEVRWPTWSKLFGWEKWDCTFSEALLYLAPVIGWTHVYYMVVIDIFVQMERILKTKQSNNAKDSKTRVLRRLKIILLTNQVQAFFGMLDCLMIAVVVVCSLPYYGIIPGNEGQFVAILLPLLSNLYSLFVSWEYVELLCQLKQDCRQDPRAKDQYENAYRACTLDCERLYLFLRVSFALTIISLGIIIDKGAEGWGKSKTAVLALTHVAMIVIILVVSLAIGWHVAKTQADKELQRLRQLGGSLDV